jgi:drug/metabolite transporter (DMT)-like permease
VIVVMALFLGVSGAGIVLIIRGQHVGLLLLLAGLILEAAFHLWARRAWAKHRSADQ